MSDNTNENIYTLYDEDGVACEFEHLDTVEFDGGEYCIFIPVEDSEEYGVEILQIVSDEGDEESLRSVEDEEVLSEVYEVFKERNSEFFDFSD